MRQEIITVYSIGTNRKACLSDTNEFDELVSSLLDAIRHIKAFMDRGQVLGRNNLSLPDLYQRRLSIFHLLSSPVPVTFAGFGYSRSFFVRQNASESHKWCFSVNR